MLRLLTWSPQGPVNDSDRETALHEALARPEIRFWLDLEEPSPEEMNLLTTPFHFHPAALDDVRAEAVAPRLQVFGGYAFLVLHRLFYHFETERCAQREFEVFISERFIVTLHGSHLARTFSTARSRAAELPEALREYGTGYPLFLLLELAIRDYEPAFEQWQERVDELEQQVLAGNNGQNIPDQILQFKKLVTVMRKSLVPEREVIKQLCESGGLPFMGPAVQPYFKSLNDDMNALVREVERLGEHTGSVFDIYATMLTIKANEVTRQLSFVMQRLTIAATIFLPLTFIVGVYGMNFESMPELKWPGFYYLLWGFMIALVAGMLLFFRKKKWL